MASSGDVDVTVLERSELCSGGTGRSSGVVRAHYGVPSLAAMARKGQRVLERGRELLGADTGFVRTGYVVGVGEGDVVALHANVALHRGLGIDVDLVDHDTVELWRRLRPQRHGADPTEMLIVAEGERPIGLVQGYRIGDHPQWHHALGVVSASADAVGIDYLIGEPGATGRGLGTAMIRRFVDDIWRRHPAAPAAVVAVQQHNPASWRALENAGFRRVWSGVLQSDDASDAGPSHIYTTTRPVVDAVPTPIRTPSAG